MDNLRVTNHFRYGQYFRRDFGPWGLPTTETPGLTNMACDVNRGDVRDQRPAMGIPMKPISIPL